MSGFRIEQKPLEGGIVLLKIYGSVDTHSFEQFEQTIDDNFVRGQKRLILDFKEVPYISSAGAGVLLGCYQRFEVEDGKLVILNPSVNVMHAMEILEISETYTIVYDQTLAIKAFAAG